MGHHQYTQWIVARYLVSHCLNLGVYVTDTIPQSCTQS